jgi:hypothetical protein
MPSLRLPVVSGIGNRTKGPGVSISTSKGREAEDPSSSPTLLSTTETISLYFCPPVVVQASLESSERRERARDRRKEKEINFHTLLPSGEIISGERRGRQEESDQFSRFRVHPIPISH